MQIILLDEMCGRLEELSEKLDKGRAFTTLKGPMTRMFRRDQQYQFATIPAGSSGRVFYLENPQPDLLVGIVKEVANSWFANTYLDWYTDYTPKTVQYVIGDVHAPKEFEEGIPFHKKVEWIAYNNDTASHVFEVLCDGFFLPKELYNEVVE